MFKLMVISGPNRGTTYPLQSGETSIGRQPGNSIVLPSAKVSRSHCVLTLVQEEVVLRDLGSANGTFVNGTLARTKKLAAGDRVSVGEFVLELKEVVQARSEFAPAAPRMAAVIPFPSGAPEPVGAPAPLGSGGEGPPADLYGKAAWAVEKFLMPPFYSWNLTSDWKSIWIALMSIFLIGNMVISIFPMIQAHHETVIQETKRRAGALARQLADRNSAALASNAQSRLNLGNVDSEEGVRTAILADLKLSILAPASKAGTSFSMGAEATLVTRLARARYNKGNLEAYVGVVGDTTVLAVEPVVVFDQSLGRNVAAGLAIVSIDTKIAELDFGQIGLIYSEALIFTAALAFLLSLILYRLFLKPIEVLNEDIDRALKGESSVVTRSFKRDEFGPLYDVINAALQRVAKGGAGGGSSGGDPAQVAQTWLQSMQAVLQVPKLAVVLFDRERKIAALNDLFSEISGIRSDSGIGQDISAVARDQAVGSFITDLLSRAESSGGAGVQEDFEFSGTGFQMTAIAFDVGGGFVYGLLGVRKD